MSSGHAGLSARLHERFSFSTANVNWGSSKGRQNVRISHFGAVETFLSGTVRNQKELMSCGTQCGKPGPWELGCPERWAISQPQGINGALPGSSSGTDYSRAPREWNALSNPPQAGGVVCFGFFSIWMTKSKLSTLVNNTVNNCRTYCLTNMRGLRRCGVTLVRTHLAGQKRI